MVANRDLPLTSLFRSRRARALASGAILALSCTACSTLRPAWKHSKSAEPAGPTPSAQTEQAPGAPTPLAEPQTASSSIAYPFAGGASLPTAAANTPTVRR